MVGYRENVARGLSNLLNEIEGTLGNFATRSESNPSKLCFAIRGTFNFKNPQLEEVQPINYMSPSGDERYHLEYSITPIGNDTSGHFELISSPDHLQEKGCGTLSPEGVFDLFTPDEQTDILCAVQDTIIVFGEEIAEDVRWTDNSMLFIWIETDKTIRDRSS